MGETSLGRAKFVDRGQERISRWITGLRSGHGRRMIKDVAATARRHGHTIWRAAGIAARLRLAEMIIESLVGAETDQPAADTAVPIRLPGVDRPRIWLRPRSRDWAALEFLDGKHHLPPAEVGDAPKYIAVFGANIGLLTAELADAYPEARLLGVEPEQQNAALAQRNLARFGDRVSLVEAAVWHRDEQLDVAWGRDAWGLNLTGAAADQQPGSRQRIPAVDAGRLLDRFTSGAPLDYLLINIESAWYEMLRHGAWTRNVECVKIEIQAHYDEAVPLLQALGFHARLIRLSWGAYVIGVRMG